jgi:hypothetical protein
VVDAAAEIATRRAFQLDDVGAELGQKAGGGGAGQVLGRAP